MQRLTQVMKRKLKTHYESSMLIYCLGTGFGIMLASMGMVNYDGLNGFIIAGIGVILTGLTGIFTTKPLYMYS